MRPCRDGRLQDQGTKFSEEVIIPKGVDFEVGIGGICWLSYHPYPAIDIILVWITSG